MSNPPLEAGNNQHISPSRTELLYSRRFNRKRGDLRVTSPLVWGSNPSDPTTITFLLIIVIQSLILAQATKASSGSWYSDIPSTAGTSNAGREAECK